MGNPKLRNLLFMCSFNACKYSVFFVFALQCTSTIAIIKRETNSWWWPTFTFLYMTALAYVGALLTYQIGTAVLG